PTTFPTLRDTLPGCATTRINIFLCLFHPRPSRLCGSPYLAAPQPELTISLHFSPKTFPPLRDTLPVCARTRINIILYLSLPLPFVLVRHPYPASSSP